MANNRLCLKPENEEKNFNINPQFIVPGFDNRFTGYVSPVRNDAGKNVG